MVMYKQYCQPDNVRIYIILNIPSFPSWLILSQNSVFFFQEKNYLFFLPCVSSYDGWKWRKLKEVYRLSTIILN
jgi:hypothetical protein